MSSKEIKRREKQRLVNLAIEEINRNASKIRLTQLFKLLRDTHGIDCYRPYSTFGYAIYNALIKDPKIGTERINGKRFFWVK